MGDRLTTIDTDRKLEGCAPFWEGELGPHVTHGGMGRGLPPYNRTKWHLDPSSSLATMDMDRKLGRGAVPPFWGGELGPHLAHCGLGRGLPPRQLAS